ncbi:Glycogenin-1 [Cryptotermes secundus]|uniref:glycogenin glucosyltransferase n=1 Tax=Cryptotermes secundus TaxID=105785 RepID=A0A2J7PQN1_9NEOP|nr:cell surface glycoprotein 1 isoform X2 [Cryptotermes secundus]PNF18606.1 Glycogenin-1 [Cryptotermes secundus]
MGVFAWVTLATNDSYSLGALVLGHSLRRVGTPHDLVVLVTPGVSASMRDRLSSVFTLVQEVNLLDSRDEANLALLERPELGITFTKLHCWRLTQYEKCVFLDADTLVLKNSDELFEREELSAAPDPGWPDCFNSGVFVYRPSLDTFNALIKFALSKGSFDGGDQGLLNLFFSDWATKDISRHLPFIYNMVSTATYSYLPAYKAFGESAKIAHFIGSNKPWLQYFDSETRLVRPPQGSEHLQRLLQLWWDIFCSTVHPSLSPDMLGLAGALAQMTLGVPRSAEQTAFEEHMRKQAWEQGNMDYMGRDSFDNIWRKITETLAEAPPKPETQKAATGEVPTIKPIPEPIPLLSELAEPKSTTLPSTGADETPGITSSATKPTEPTLLMTQDSEPSLPKSAAPSVPSVPPEGPTPSPSPGDQVKVEQTVPHTPLVTEATPPTSPPVTASTADNRALTVDVSPLETPPLGSTPEKPLSDTQIPAPATQTVQVSESPVQAEAVYVSEQETKSTESKELPVPTQGIPSAIPAETKPTEDLSASQETLPAQKSPVSQPSPTQENPPASVALSSPVPSSLQEVPVIPSIPQVPLTQESLSAVSAPLASIPEPSQVPEVPVTSSNAQAPPAQESASASIPEPSPTPEVPVTPTLVHVPLTQESSSGSLPLASTPEPSPVSEVPATLSVAQVPPIQESSSVPVPPVSTPEQSPVASPIPQQPPPIQEVPADLTVPQQAASTEEALATPVTKHVEQKEPSSVQQHLPPTPPASPDSVETKPVLASPSTQAPVSSEKTEVKQREQKGSPPADKTESHSESAAEDIHQKPTAPVQASTTIDKTKPTLSETSPVIEKQDPEPTPTADQKVGPPVPPSPGLLPSAPAETAPTAAPPPSKPAPAEPPSPAPSSKSKEPPKTPTPAKAEGPAPTAPSKTQSSPVQDAPKKATEAKSSTGEKEGSAPSAQSKPEESPKSVPSKPSVSESPPSTPEASPSDQAPVPPKRRGHKGVGTAPPDQGAASKPAAQSPQSKGPKPGQKSKK